MEQVVVLNVIVKQEIHVLQTLAYVTGNVKLVGLESTVNVSVEFCVRITSNRLGPQLPKMGTYIHSSYYTMYIVEAVAVPWVILTPRLHL